MKQRWVPVAILAGVLFAVNAVGRLIAKAVVDDDAMTIRVGLATMAAVGVVLMVAAYRWAERYPMPRALGDLAVAAVAGCLLSVLVGPLIAGSRPLAEGSGWFFREIWMYTSIAVGGVLLGILIVMALGRDWKSQAWKRYAEQARAKPRRVVRR